MDTIRSLGNAGLWMELGGIRVAVDPICRHTRGVYQTTPDHIVRALLSGELPYGFPELLLITHDHTDHFHPRFIRMLLDNHPQTRVVASPAVLEKLRLREHAVRLEAGETLTLNLCGLIVTALRTVHDGKGPGLEDCYHLSFLLRGARSVLITGDARPDLENFRPLLPLGKLDVLAAPFPYITLARVQSRLLPALAPSQLLICHLPTDRYDGRLWLEAADRQGEKLAQEGFTVHLLREAGQTAAL